MTIVDILVRGMLKYLTADIAAQMSMFVIYKVI